MGRPKVKVKPLYGGGPEGPLSVLLTIDDLGILLDCGWSEQLPLSEINALKEVVPQVDLVLLSQPSTAHVGALPHAVTRLGLKAQIFATAPIQNMGQLFLYDLLLALKGCSEVDAMSFEDIDAAFELVTKLKHGQHTTLQVKGWELVLTAHASGHMLGGTVWSILVAGQSIVYAPAFNHHRERHLAATSIGKTIKRPALLISRSPSPTTSAVPTSQRNSKMLDCVMAALRRDGTVLIPTDTAGRVLELILVLADHWDKNKLPYPLMLLNSMAFNTLEFAKASLEFMDDGLFNTYVNTLHNPFHLRMLKLLHRTDDLTGLRARPRVVLASMASLERGYARHLLAELAADPKNCLLLVQPPAPGTLASTILEGARSRAAPGEAWELAVELRRRVRLEGAELEERQRQLLLQQQQQQQEEALLRPQDEGGGEAGAEVGTAVGAGAAAQRPMRESSVSLQRMASSRSHRSFTPMHRAASAPLPAAAGAAGAEASSAGDGTGAPADMEVDAADADPEADPDVLVDGFTVPQGAAAPMFPFEAGEEPAPEWDDYGAKVDLPAWLRPGEDAELEEGLDSGSEGQGGEEEADALEEDQLTKVVAEQRQLQLRLQVEAFDFQGLSDLRSFAHIVNSICPRHIVVVHSASAEAARQLASAVEASAGDSQLHLPEIGEEVEVVLEAALPPLAMGRELLQRLKLRTEEGLSLGWLQGVVHSEGVAEPQLVPSQQLEDGAGEGGIFIGNVRISRLFAALSEASIPAEFHGSGLVCSDGVVVRVEGEAGRVQVEGPLCPQYFKVRDVVYNQYHVC